MEIVPFQKIGNIALGMSVEQVHEILKGKPTGVTNLEANEFSEMWLKDGFSFYYENSIVEGINCFRPAIPTYNGLAIYNVTYEEWKNINESFPIIFDDQEVYFKGTGFTLIFDMHYDEIYNNSVPIGCGIMSNRFIDKVWDNR